MAELGATPSHQFFAGFNAFFSSTWQKTRVEQVSRKVFHLGLMLGHPTLWSIKNVVNLLRTLHFGRQNCAELSKNYKLYIYLSLTKKQNGV